jgi:RNA polymerase sigma-70 factor (ECF subfamily)
MATTENSSPASVGSFVQSQPPERDPELVAAYVARGDELAFSALVVRHHRWVFRLVSSVLGPGGVGDAQDVTQDVFVALTRHLRSFRHESAFATWLRRVALNMALDRRRHPRWRLPHVSLQAVRYRPTTHVREDPHGSTAANEQARRVVGSLRALPSGIRQAIYLRYWKGLSAEEISSRLEIPTGTVKSRLHRGRRLLRQRGPSLQPLRDGKRCI